MNDTIKYCFCLIAAAMLFTAPACASFVSITTYTDNNGYFRYSLFGSNEQYRFGGTSNLLCVQLPVRAVSGIVATPNWHWYTNGPDCIFWEYTGSTFCVLDDGAVSFAYTSMCFDIGPYDDMNLTGAFPRAVIMGALYDTNRVLFTSSAWSGSVASTNVTGYELAALAGPIPEPAIGVIMGVGLFLMRARRR